MNGADASPAPTRRLSYIDWMRGLAILIMIEAHVLDAWTRPADRKTLAFGCLAVLAGFAAPMFLFLAGASASLAASARERRTGNRAAAGAAVRRRGWQVFGLAYLFRFQAYVLSPRALLAGLLKVDILNIMGPSIVAAAALWQSTGRVGRRLVILGAAALAVALVTPLVRTSPLVSWLPPVVQWYIRPAPGRNNFTFFPWSGFVFAGAFVGTLLDGGRRGSTRRLHAILGGGALLFASCSYAASDLPSIYADSHFWTSAPTFFLLRVGIVTAVLSAVFFWEERRRVLPLGGWSPMAQFGRSSLLVYWIHVELVYGIFTHPLHHELPLGTALLAFAVFTLLMFGMVVAKDGAVAQWKARRAARAQRPEAEAAA